MQPIILADAGLTVRLAGVCPILVQWTESLLCCRGVTFDTTKPADKRRASKQAQVIHYAGWHLIHRTTQGL